MFENEFIGLQFHLVLNCQLIFNKILITLEYFVFNHSFKKCFMMSCSLFPTLQFRKHLILPNSEYVLVYNALSDNYQNVSGLAQYIG